MRTLLVTRRYEGFTVWYGTNRYVIPESGQLNLIRLMNNNHERFNCIVRHIDFFASDFIFYDAFLQITRK